MKITDVHTEHCCIIHGCKYGHPDCTVTTGRAPQSYSCESCEDMNAVWRDCLGLAVQTSNGPVFYRLDDSALAHQTAEALGTVVLVLHAVAAVPPRKAA